MWYEVHIKPRQFVTFYVTTLRTLLTVRQSCWNRLSTTCYQSINQYSYISGMTKRRPTGYNCVTTYRKHWVNENVTTSIYKSNRYFYTACVLWSCNQTSMCCVEVAVVSARGGGGCIVVMRWIVVATIRVKHDLTVEQLCWTVRRPQRHTIRQSSGESARSSRDAERGQS